MKKMVIFSFYDKDGIVDDYIKFLLNELKIIAQRIIIVVNGNITEIGWDIFSRYTKEIIIRANRGFDAGAYAYVFNHYLLNEEWNDWDNIILCNDTFFGPFISFQEIFQEMENKKCDIWGLNGYFNVIFPHIQSYFLVFKKKIIINKNLFKYFKDNINENTLNINEVYCQFEIGLFDYLVRVCGYKYAIYCDECYLDVYGESYFYLKKYHLPVVKKKTFGIYDSQNWLCTLSFIKYETNYDIENILSVINRRYNLKLDINSVKTIENYLIPLEKGIAKNKNTDASISYETSKYKFYIYGIGMVGCKAYWRYAKENSNFIGFVVSDDKNIPRDKLFGKSIFHLKEILPLLENCKVLLGLGPEFTPEILDKFKDKTKVIRIY